MSEIKVGDVVMIKSGGPGMVVVDSTGALVRCHWYCEARSEYGTEDFLASSLDLVKSAD